VGISVQLHLPQSNLGGSSKEFCSRASQSVLLIRFPIPTWWHVKNYTNVGINSSCLLLLNVSMLVHLDGPAKVTN
jgi:hypothetical protein